MNEKVLYKNVGIYSLVLSLISLCISWFIFKDIKIIYGLLIGGMGRLLGFCFIIINSFTTLKTREAYRSLIGYILRLFFYGILVYFAIYIDANVFALLLGFSIVNIVVYYFQIKLNREGVYDGRS